MKRVLPLLLLFVTALAAPAQTEPGATPAEAQQAANTTVAAATTVIRQEPDTPDFLEHLVDSVLGLFDVRSSENTMTHYVIAVLFLVGALLLRRVVVTLVFGFLRKLASRTQTTFDDKLFPELEGPVGTLVMVTGIVSALKVLKLPEASDHYLAAGSTVAFSLIVFWGLLRAFDALLSHVQEIAVSRNLGVAAFMPWIKKSLVTLFVVLGGLMVVQSLGYDVKALLAGLGIGGLAFALAAQDTIANLFGSIVVAIDQPFKIGEAVKIGANEGVVEDIGLRSTKLRTPSRNLIVIPNKMVAAEAVINNSRFVGRRIEQVFGLTYDTKPEQMDAIVAEIRGIITREAEVDPTSVHTYFRDFNTSSLDIWLAYNTKSADFAKSMALRQRINLAIMRAIAAKDLKFAYPTTTLHVASTVAAGDAGTEGKLKN